MIYSLAPDAIAEQALLEVSRWQREAVIMALEKSRGTGEMFEEPPGFPEDVNGLLTD